MEYEDIAIDTSEDVYPPSEDSRLAAELISYYLSTQPKGKTLSVLDLGTATGILGIFCASRDNVKNVTCADINPSAVKLAEKNAEKNRASLRVKPSFLKTDLFSKIRKEDKYDLIIFNAPYLRAEEEKRLDDIRWSGGKEGVELSISFLEGAVPHLYKGGALILVSSSLSNIPKLKKRLDDLELRIVKEYKVHYFFEDILAWLISLQPD